MEDKAAMLAQLFDEDIYLILKNDANETDVSAVTEVKCEAVGKTTIPFSGKNNKQILILVQNQGSDICTAANLDFLTKILSAIKLSLDDVALINASQFESEKHQLPSFTKFISFGAEVFLKSQNISVPVGKYVSTKTALLADSIEQVQADVNLKKQLWGALQQMFVS